MIHRQQIGAKKRRDFGRIVLQETRTIKGAVCIKDCKEEAHFRQQTTQYRGNHGLTAASLRYHVSRKTEQRSPARCWRRNRSAEGCLRKHCWKWGSQTNGSVSPRRVIRARRKGNAHNLKKNRLYSALRSSRGFARFLFGGAS